MKKITSFLAQLPFVGPGYKRGTTVLPVKQKKSFMIETIREVGHRLSETTGDVIDAESKLKGLKEEFNEASLEKREAVERLRDVQIKLKFTTSAIEHLRLKDSEVVKETDDCIKIKKELETRTSELKDEQSLDIEKAGLQSQFDVMEKEIVPYREQLKTLESEKKSLTDTKDNLARELNSAGGAINVLKTEVQELQARSENLGKHILSIEEVREKYKAAKEEQDRSGIKLGELEPQEEKSRRELNALKKQQQESQDRFMLHQREKEKLEGETEEMETRKERMDNLNEALKVTTGERDELERKLRDLEARMDIAGKETGDLDKELEDIKRNKIVLGQERENFEEKNRPIVDIIHKVEGLEEDAKNELGKCSQRAEDIDTRKRDIKSIQFELQKHHEAFEEISLKCS
jgi:chromosome segregation ATPase